MHRRTLDAATEYAAALVASGSYGSTPSDTNSTAPSDSASSTRDAPRSAVASRPQCTTPRATAKDCHSGEPPSLPDIRVDRIIPFLVMG